MLLEVDHLSITYNPHRKPVAAVKDVSFRLEAGRSLGIVGESGSGKSSLGLAIMRLLPTGARTEGKILIGGTDMLTLSEAEMRRRRGQLVGMVFQDSLAALNPVFTVGSQLIDTLRRHNDSMTRAEAKRRAGEMLEEVGLSAERLQAFPHQFSGGMRQRVMTAAALAPGPQFLVCDEATSDLDTVSQRQILDLLKQVQSARNLGLIAVSHDLGVINYLCEDVAVLYRGDLVEYGPVGEVLARPQHWYTRGLVATSRKDVDERGYLQTLPSRAHAGDDGSEGAEATAGSEPVPAATQEAARGDDRV